MFDDYFSKVPAAQRKKSSKVCQFFQKIIKDFSKVPPAVRSRIDQNRTAKAALEKPDLKCRPVRDSFVAEKK